MIAVIADDLTGAAEIAGIALGYGLTISMHTGPGDVSPSADLIIVSTDARSKPLEDALRITETSLRWLQSLHPRFIFKKTDSLLRGHVREELALQMELSGLQGALLIPANPSLGRTIIAGQYLVSGVPLADTPFALDPEFPAKSSDVTEILSSAGAISIGLEDALPAMGIKIGNVGSSSEMNEWAGHWTEDQIPAGGGDFFSALLNTFRVSVSVSQLLPSRPLIFVKGTAFGDEAHPVRQATMSNGTAMLITPSMIMSGLESNIPWVQKAVDILMERQMLFVGFDHEAFREAADPVLMRRQMAVLVDAICTARMPAEVFIEGGSTAQAILDQMNVRSTRPVGVWTRGVIRLDTLRSYVTVKPGSYPLPASIIELFA